MKNIKINTDFDVFREILANFLSPRVNSKSRTSFVFNAPQATGSGPTFLFVGVLFKLAAFHFLAFMRGQFGHALVFSLMEWTMLYYIAEAFLRHRRWQNVELDPAQVQKRLSELPTFKSSFVNTAKTHTTTGLKVTKEAAKNTHETVKKKHGELKEALRKRRESKEAAKAAEAAMQIQQNGSPAKIEHAHARLSQGSAHQAPHNQRAALRNPSPTHIYQHNMAVNFARAGAHHNIV